MNLSGFGEVIVSGLTCLKKDIRKDAFLPGRNFLFLVAAGSYAYQEGAHAIAVGFLNEATHLFPDQTTAFIQVAERTIAEALGRPIRILAPLMMFNKADVLSLAQKRGIEGTYSCHAGGSDPCGQCVSCLEILNALGQGR